MKQNMNASKIQKERLKAFADYLSTQELVARNYFSPTLQIGMQIDDGEIIPVNPLLYMARFELPHIFPNDWVYDNKFQPIWKKRKKSDPFLSVQEWFGISEEQMEHLFFQGMQSHDRFGGRIIDARSTQQDLAYNVVELIRMSEQKVTAFNICLN